MDTLHAAINNGRTESRDSCIDEEVLDPRVHQQAREYNGCYWSGEERSGDERSEDGDGDMMGEPAELWEQLICVITEQVKLRLAPAPAVQDYSQDNLPPNLTKRFYMENCKLGRWTSQKIGRLRVTRKADFETWLAGHKHVPKTIRAPKVSNDIQFDEDAALAAVIIPRASRCGTRR